MPKLIYILLTILAAGPAVGQHWESEQVDTAPWGTGVQMRWHPDGRLFLCYGSDSGNIRLAWKDSVWHYEDVPTQHWPGAGTNEFTVGPGGRLGVSYMYAGGQVRCLVREDSLWEEFAGSGHAGMHSRAPVAIDADGVLSYVICVRNSPDHVSALRVSRGDTTWVVDSVMPSYWGDDVKCHCYRISHNGTPYCVLVTYHAFLSIASLGGLVYRDSVWVTESGSTGRYNAYSAISAAMEIQDNLRLCYWEYYYEDPPESSLWYNGEIIDSTRTQLTSLCIDSLNRPQLAYVQASGLRFRFKHDSGWQVMNVAPDVPQAIDMALTDSLQPVIAYSTGDGVWIASGSDVLNIIEAKPSVRTERSTSTIARGSLLLPGKQPAVLLDITGRTVADLHPGQNDIRHVSPGVYFLRSADNGSRPATRKIVVQR